ncbi:MAG TPA: creatininase family protein [Vicinamibacterales bacterium]|nr:creatininase family protein [Vicinamibacterales bacterium]
MRYLLLTIALTTASVTGGNGQALDTAKGVRLEQHTWVEAERLLTPDRVVVIPLGAALKEHGPHLKLRNDLTLADYFADRVAAAAPVAVTPPLTYHFYPAFLEYPGSTSLTLDTARDSTVQVARSLARYGPRRFYVLNTGISTVRALEPAAAALAREGILLHYTNLAAALEPIAAPIRRQERGSHADEIETSMMLYIDPAAVNMKLAVKDVNPLVPPMRFRRNPGATGVYSPSGVWGDPTLATRDKGRQIVEGLVSTMLRDIEALRVAALPSPSMRDAAPAPGGPTSRTSLGAPGPNGCTPGDERSIRRIEPAFNVAWTNLDPIALAALWSIEGDIVHADGYTERGRVVIQQNRAEQFRRKEFRGSKHILSFGNVRCINESVAVVDSKWELRGVLDAAGNSLPSADGLSTLVVEKSGDQWAIEAYRYNVKPGSPPPPKLLPKPGYPDKR